MTRLDYGAVLAALRAERAQFDAAIEAVEKLMGVQEPTPPHRAQAARGALESAILATIANGTATRQRDIAAHVKRSQSNVSQVLVRLVANGEIERVGRGQYRYPTTLGDGA